MEKTGMKFWAIAYLYEEEVFWDFALDDTTMDLSAKCFLPTEEIALDFIDNELNKDFVPVEITLERLERNGSWTYVRDIVERWDEVYD